MIVSIEVTYDTHRPAMRAKFDRVRTLTSGSQPSNNLASETGARGTWTWTVGNRSAFRVRFTSFTENQMSGCAAAIPSNPTTVVSAARIKPLQMDVNVGMECPPFIHRVYRLEARPKIQIFPLRGSP
jgi:hypothetical protein